ncbi:hypothetical protein ASPWEDRAFT_59757 [Aspergillus wentii DTO 134E9]|uniref:Uncharacterized protein n=1 Tax=Aspergillus wentii DTO 134E9 TaxID=1073089 RepID=A0A1L9RKL9_ASPWE|nr:uncharacterized protein ASPWEDRAFT_59757 [Aspergillus wentii DTO 134E9]OJJ35461.1 hypothetical protein ASPWEDRAFT_59757 [Aspergillus wentii DTO 134E9]
MYLRGPEPGQFKELHQEGAEIDIIFDFDEHLMAIRETIEDHTRKYTFSSTYVRLGVHNTRFVNLQGLADNSLLLTLRMKASACAERGGGLRFREKVSGFIPEKKKSRLRWDLYMCDWPERTIQVLIPEDRTTGWKTVALVLLAFQRVTMENWCCLVNMKDEPPIAGLDWREIEADTQLDMEKKKGGDFAVEEVDIKT